MKIKTFIGILREHRHVFSKKIWIQSLNLVWLDLDLSSGQMKKWMPPSNSTSQIAHSTCEAEQAIQHEMACSLDLLCSFFYGSRAISLTLMQHFHLVTFFDLTSIVSGSYSYTVVAKNIFTIRKTVRQWALVWPNLFFTYGVRCRKKVTPQGCKM